MEPHRETYTQENNLNQKVFTLTTKIFMIGLTEVDNLSNQLLADNHIDGL